jgi:hypothetical protein
LHSRTSLAPILFGAWGGPGAANTRLLLSMSVQQVAESADVFPIPDSLSSRLPTSPLNPFRERDLPAVLAFVEATLISRSAQKLAPQLKGTLNRLHQQVARAIPEILATKQWRIECAPEIAAQHFWGDHVWH